MRLASLAAESPLRLRREAMPLPVRREVDKEVILFERMVHAF